MLEAVLGGPMTVRSPLPVLSADGLAPGRSEADGRRRWLAEPVTPSRTGGVGGLQRGERPSGGVAR